MTFDETEERITELKGIAYNAKLSDHQRRAAGREIELLEGEMIKTFGHGHFYRMRLERLRDACRRAYPGYAY